MAGSETMVSEFRKCLVAISHARAGWDFSLSGDQRAKEARSEREAMRLARTIWKDNPGLHDALRVAFAELGPLATTGEIENGSQASIRGGEA